MSGLLRVIVLIFIFGCQTHPTSDIPSQKRSLSNVSKPEIWSYEAGPTDSAMGKELIELNANIPNMPAISEAIVGEQKFRPAFGPIPWRMLQEPNSVKILFIGQDGTHVAEAAGRPATAGFGGRAQDLANYFGVDYSAAFINTYAFTIKGQYGSFNTPYVRQTDQGQDIAFSGFVDNKLWLMTHGADSPINKWRNDLIEWIIRNNKDSLKLIVVFGGAARDAISSFVVSRGGQVGTRTTEDRLKNIKMPVIDLRYAGGNNEFPVPLDSSGNDIYEKLMGRPLAYDDSKKGEAEQKAAMDILKAKSKEGIEKMVFLEGGVHNSGILNAAQLGGYDVDKISVNNKNTISLKGLKLKNAKNGQPNEILNDILVVDLPHPTALSNMDKQAASDAVTKAASVINSYAEQGWSIEPDHNQMSRFSQRAEYEYGRGYIGPEYYDFGTPKNRMVSVSDAVRHSPPVINLGTRDRAPFDDDQIQKMLNALPAAGFLEKYNKKEMFVARPRTTPLRDSFDRGPGAEYAKIMKQNLDMDKLSEPKAIVLNDSDVKKASSFSRNETIRAKYGRDAFHIKTDPIKVADFGHYRGTFVKPRVVILADPDGSDDILTSRALTGARGQYLHGLMQDMGVGDKYLVFKTIPFGMDGASEEDWRAVLQQTEVYREKVFAKLFAENKPVVVMTDGVWAQQEMVRILNKTNIKIPIVAIQRMGFANNSGIKEAATQIHKISDFKNSKISGAIADIPRSHLPFYARFWEGTSGNRVIDAQIKSGLKIRKEDKSGKVTVTPVHESYFAGLAFGIVVPDWAAKQKDAKQSEQEWSGMRALKMYMCEQGLPLPKEPIPVFFKRKQQAEQNCKQLVDK